MTIIKTSKIILPALLLAALIFNSVLSNNASAQWKVQTRDSLYNFNDVEFINVYTGWVIGNNGKIFKTQDGGYHWHQQLNNSPVNNLQRIHFPSQSVPGNTGYIIGYVDNSLPNAGVLLETNDSGYIWQDVWLRNFYYMKDVQFFNPYTGFIIGGRDSTSSLGYILKTTNGGFGATTTLTIDTVLNFGIFKTLSFINTNTGYVCAVDSNKNSTIIKTLNSGGDWFIKSHLSNIDIHQMQFLSELTGFAVGGGYNGAGAKILKTTNGGVNWSVQTFGMDGNYFNGISFAYDRGRWRGWVCGENGNVYNTTNLGVTWYKQAAPEGFIQNLNGICFLDLDHGWSSGNSGGVVSTYTGGDPTSSISPINGNIPTKYNIAQNYPNPFNPETNIKFSIPENSLVRISVYNSLGQIIENLVNERLSAGEYVTKFHGEALSSGIYFYTISAGSYNKTMKMLLVK